jgi:hypothetical protein
MQIPPWNSEFISFSNAASPAAFFCLKICKQEAKQRRFELESDDSATF